MSKTRITSNILPAKQWKITKALQSSEGKGLEESKNEYTPDKL